MRGGSEMSLISLNSCPDLYNLQLKEADLGFFVEKLTLYFLSICNLNQL